MSKNQQADPAKLGKAYRFMERFWLVAAVISVGLSTYILIVDGVEAGKYYMLLPVLALTIWFMRRRVRKSYDRMVEAQKNEQ